MSMLVFLLGYLALMVPTYVLPYFGSNSAVVNAVSAGTGMGLTPMWWAHIWSLSMLVIIAYMRGGRINKLFLPALSVAAALFDMVPVLSMIPLAPTVLHLVVIVLGVKGSEDADRVSSANKKGLIAASVASIAALVGMISFGPSAPAPIPQPAQDIAAPAAKPAAPAVKQNDEPVNNAVQSTQPAKPKLQTKKPSEQRNEQPAPSKPTGSTVRYMKI